MSSSFDLGGLRSINDCQNALNNIKYREQRYKQRLELLENRYRRISASERMSYFQKEEAAKLEKDINRLKQELGRHDGRKKIFEDKIEKIRNRANPFAKN